MLTPCLVHSGLLRGGPIQPSARKNMLTRKLVALLLIVLTMSLGACAPKGPTTNFRGQYYPQCFDPITRLCQDQDNSAKAKSAGAGALLGALAGAVVGAASTGKWQGAVAGAAIGAAAGGVAGYVYQHIQQIKDQERRLEAYREQFGKEAQDLDLQKASTLSAYKCYQEQMQILKENVKEGKISKTEAKARAAEIRAGLEELKKFWEERTAQFDANQSEVDRILANEGSRPGNKAAQTKYVQMHRQAAANRQANNKFRSESQVQEKSASERLNDLDTLIAMQTSNV